MSAAGHAAFTADDLTLSTPLLVFPWYATKPDFYSQAPPASNENAGPLQATGKPQAAVDPAGPIQATGSYHPQKREAPEATIAADNAIRSIGLGGAPVGNIPQEVIDLLGADNDYKADLPFIGSCLTGGPPVSFSCLVRGPLAAASAADLIGSSTVSMTIAGCFRAENCKAGGSAAASPAGSAGAGTITDGPKPPAEGANSNGPQPSPVPVPMPAPEPGPAPSSPPGKAQQGSPLGPPTMPLSSIRSQVADGQLLQPFLVSHSAGTGSADSPHHAPNVPNPPGNAIPSANQSPGQSTATQGLGNVILGMFSPPNDQPPKLTLSLAPSASNLIVNGVKSDLKANGPSPSPLLNGPNVPIPASSGTRFGQPSNGGSEGASSPEQPDNGSPMLPPIIIGSQTFTVNSASFYVINGQTLQPGSSAIVVPSPAGSYPTSGPEPLAADSAIANGVQVASALSNIPLLEGTGTAQGGPLISGVGTAAGLIPSGTLVVGSNTNAISPNGPNTTANTFSAFTGKANNISPSRRIQAAIIAGVLAITGSP